MYNWAADQKDLILIAGHTHRPVWSSRTHLQKLQIELDELKKASETEKQEELIHKKELEIEEREKKYPPCNDSIKTIPVYFNTGCCKFDDGDITGIEIENGVIRLIKWSSKDFQRKELEKDQLLSFFSQIKNTQ